MLISLIVERFHRSCFDYTDCINYARHLLNSLHPRSV